MARLLIGNIKGPQGVQGPTGPQGPQGVQGNPGQGVPTGGSAGQYLIKQSATNYDADWGAITTDSAPTSGGTNPITSGGVYTEAGKLAAGMAILANGNTHAAITSGQFVYVRGHGTLADGPYKATANIATNGALSTSNLTAEPSGGLNALNADIASLNGKITKNFVSIYSSDNVTIGDSWTYVTSITITKPSAIYIKHTYSVSQPTGTGISSSSNSFTPIAVTDGENRGITAVLPEGTYYAFAKAARSGSNMITIFVCEL